MVRTSEDAAHPAQRDARKALDALLRDDCAEPIHVNQEFALRHHVRAMAAMRPPTLMH